MAERETWRTVTPAKEEWKTLNITPEQLKEFTGPLPTREQIETQRDIDENLSLMGRDTFLGASVPPLVAGGIGFVTKNPATIPPGYVLGTVLKQRLQKQWPGAFGTPPYNAEGTLKDIGLDLSTNLATDLLFGPLGKPARDFGNRKLATSLAGKFLKKPLGAEERAWLNAHPDFDATTGQLGGDRFAAGLEDVTQHGLKRDIIEAQQGYFQNERDALINKFGYGDLDAEQLAKVINTQSVQGYKQWSEVTKKLYTNLRNEGALTKGKAVFPVLKNGKIVDTVINEVEGPVKFDNSFDMAKDVIAYLKKNYEPRAGQPLYNIVKDDPAAEALVSSLHNIAVTRNAKGELQPTSLAVALDVKRAIGERGYAKSFAKSAKEEFMFKRLERLIDQDIKAGISNFDNASEVLQLYKTANKVNKLKMTLFKNDPYVSSLIETPLSGISNVKQILSDPVSIKHVIGGAKNPLEMRKALATEFLQDLFEKGFDKQTNRFKSSILYSDFTSRKSTPLTKALFTGAERDNIINFLKTIQTFDPNVAMAGTVALAIRAGGAGLVFAPGVIESLATGNIKGGVKTSGMLLGAVLGVRQFTEKVLMNPTYARIAAKLNHLPPTSPEAGKLAKMLFVAMKGTQIGLINSSGVKIGDAVIDKTGRPVPVRFDQAGNE